ncbi:MAG: citrate synthase/methylcitrate synthase [Reyranellaceae bacterium]
MSNSGLDGVVAADTRLSLVDGEAGRLIVAGHELPELVRDFGFEGTIALLWEGLAPEGGDRARVRTELGRARVAAFAHVPALLAATAPLTVIEALRVGLGLLPDKAPLPAHLMATGALPVFLAALLRRADRLPAVAPDAALGTAQDLLRMLHGERAPAAQEKALDAYLTTIADHGFNASTFAARVIASTQAGLISAVLGGLCALKGPLHGGAPGPVLDMLDEIGERANILPWLEKAVNDGERLMGFGHRIYKVRDPRADVLKAVVAGLGGSSDRLRFAAQVEAGAIATLRRLKPHQRLDTNVEFYTALVLEAVGLPRSAFTAVFAVGRVAGWCAHILEQEQTGRIIRPQSRYVGPMPHQPAAA